MCLTRSCCYCCACADPALWAFVQDLNDVAHYFNPTVFLGQPVCGVCDARTSGASSVVPSSSAAAAAAQCAVCVVVFCRGCAHTCTRGVVRRRSLSVRSDGSILGRLKANPLLAMEGVGVWAEDAAAGARSAGCARVDACALRRQHRVVLHFDVRAAVSCNDC